MSKRSSRQKTAVPVPIVKVTFPRTSAEEVAEMRTRFGGPGLAVADGVELGAAFDREIATYVETMLRMTSRCDDFVFEASFGAVPYPDVNLDGAFPDHVRIGFRVAGEERPVRRQLTLCALSTVVNRFWMDTLDDEMVAENLSDALYAMRLDDCVVTLGEADEGYATPPQHRDSHAGSTR